MPGEERSERRDEGFMFILELQQCFTDERNHDVAILYGILGTPGSGIDLMGCFLRYECVLRAVPPTIYSFPILQPKFCMLIMTNFPLARVMGCDVHTLLTRNLSEGTIAESGALGRFDSLTLVVCRSRIWISSRQRMRGTRMKTALGTLLLYSALTTVAFVPT